MIRSIIFSTLSVAVISLLQAQNITRVEYFIDQDPGFGNAVSIALTPSSTVEVSTSILITSLSDGFHQLYLRTQDENGSWSLTQQRNFYKASLSHEALPDITKVEYFIDNDPGFGSGTDVPIVAGPTSIENLIIDISSLDEGFHQLHIRAQDENGGWSLTQQRNFYKASLSSAALPDITKVEYFIDIDPGFGSGTDVPIDAGPTSISNLIIDISALDDGFHQLYIRGQDENGSWSLTQRRNFYKASLSSAAPPDITKVEYFIDNDPGFGLATEIAISPSVTFDSSGTLILPALDTGNHVIYLRALDSNDHWSLIASNMFRIESCPDSLMLDAVALANDPHETHFRASESIISNGVITVPENIIFDAADRVELDPHFEVQLGAVFEVLLEGCGTEETFNAISGGTSTNNYQSRKRK